MAGYEITVKVIARKISEEENIKYDNEMPIVKEFILDNITKEMIPFITERVGNALD
jgi:hypothetical protein